MVYRIDDLTAITNKPEIPTTSVGIPGYFTEGDPARGLPATRVPGWLLNMIQEELVAVCLEAGIVLEKTDNSQLLTAILEIIRKKQNS